MQDGGAALASKGAQLDEVTRRVVAATTHAHAQHQPQPTTANLLADLRAARGLVASADAQARSADLVRAVAAWLARTAARDGLDGDADADLARLVGLQVLANSCARASADQGDDEPHEANRSLVWASRLLSGGDEWASEPWLHAALTHKDAKRAGALAAVVHLCCEGPGGGRDRARTMASGMARALCRAALEAAGEDAGAHAGWALMSVVRAQGARAWDLAGSAELGEGRTTPEQAVLLSLVAAEGEGDAEHGLEFLLAAGARLSRAGGSAEDAPVVASCADTLVDALGATTARSGLPSAVRVAAVELVAPALAMDGASTPLARASRAGLLRVLSNACSGPADECTAARDRARELGALVAVLRGAGEFDPSRPSTQREWALVAVSALCQDNPANQAAIASLPGWSSVPKKPHRFVDVRE